MGLMFSSNHWRSSNHKDMVQKRRVRAEFSELSGGDDTGPTEDSPAAAVEAPFDVFSSPEGPFCLFVALFRWPPLEGCC